MEDDCVLRIPSQLRIPVLWDVTPCRFVCRFEGGGVCSIETLVLVYQFTRRQIPEEGNLRQQRFDNLSSLR